MSGFKVSLEDRLKAQRHAKEAMLERVAKRKRTQDTSQTPTPAAAQAPKKGR